MNNFDPEDDISRDPALIVFLVVIVCVVVIAAWLIYGAGNHG